MSSMRNAAKRVTHKERAQPASRKKFGLLEKHKDYIERARDFQKKQKFIKTLKTKAENRNPDEFYFKMNSSQVVDGIHQKTEDVTLDTETVQGLKTQDLGYVYHKRAIDEHKIERLKNNLHMIGSCDVKKHKLFVEDEAQVAAFDVAEHFQTDPRLADRSYNRPRAETILKNAESVVASGSTLIQRKKILSKVAKSYTELEEIEKRSKKLEKTITQLSLQRNLMGKGSKRKIEIKNSSGEKTATVYKWKRIRHK